MATKQQYTTAANAVLKAVDGILNQMGGMAKWMADQHRDEMVKYVNQLATVAVDAVIPKGN